MHLLPHEKDKYGGVLVEEHREEDDSTFSKALDESLRARKEGGVRGCWIKIPSKLAGRVPIAVAKGFEFHSCES